MDPRGHPERPDGVRERLGRDDRAVAEGERPAVPLEAVAEEGGFRRLHPLEGVDPLHEAGVEDEVVDVELPSFDMPEGGSEFDAPPEFDVSAGFRVEGDVHTPDGGIIVHERRGTTMPQ